MSKYTLHKLPKEGFIITSDEKIKIRDIVYPKTQNIHGGNKISTVISFGKDCWSEHIITELTDEKGYHPSHLLKVIAQQDQIDFSSLSIEEQKEIGWFDVEKLAFEFEKLQGNSYNNEIDFFIGGFQKAQELLSDRILDKWKSYIQYRNFENDEYIKPLIEDFKSYLSQKLWQVELEIEWHNPKTAETSHNEFNIRNFKDKNDFTPQPKFINGKVKIIKIILL
jgi:hypothetical protein